DAHIGLSVTDGAPVCQKDDLCFQTGRRRAEGRPARGLKRHLFTVGIGDDGYIPQGGSQGLIGNMGQQGKRISGRITSQITEDTLCLSHFRMAAASSAALMALMSI